MGREDGLLTKKIYILKELFTACLEVVPILTEKLKS